MKKSKLLKELNIDFVGIDEKINRVVLNSKEVEKGDIYLAIKGEIYDGNDFINEAIKNGSPLVFSERITKENVIKVSSINEIKDKLIYLIYKDIIDKTRFIGVTGTNGKTSTSNIIYQILKANLDCNVILVGTNGIYYQDQIKSIDNTTPDELVIFNFLQNIKNDKEIIVVMEVSSHALSFNRLAHIYFDLAIYLNLSHEHLDYYKTLDNYANAKSLLFSKLKNEKIAILNIDDEYTYKMINLSNKNYFFGRKTKNNSFKINKSDLTGLYFNFNNIDYFVPILGTYNVYNLVATIMACSFFGINNNQIKETLANIKQIEGRMELHKYNDKNVIIDFAHTPKAMETVLTYLREQTNNRIITLFGCGGNRDKDKRPKMMEIATLYSDEVYLTSDNPRFEDPLDIIKDTLMGMKNDHVHLFVDRRIAIYNALKNLDKNEYLLILGKGHEKEQIVLDKKIRFNDLEEVERWMKK